MLFGSRYFVCLNLTLMSLDGEGKFSKIIFVVYHREVAPMVVNACNSTMKYFDRGSVSTLHKYMNDLMVLISIDLV